MACFGQSYANTDGDTMVLQAAEDRLHRSDQLAGCLASRRDPDTIRHIVRDLLRQRIVGLASGSVDANDATWLADDPMHKRAWAKTRLPGRPCLGLSIG